MSTTDYYMIAFLIILLCYFIADLVSGNKFRDLYLDRTLEFKRLNEIKAYQFNEKNKPKEVPSAEPPPNPWNNDREPTKNEVLALAESLSKGKGIHNFFPSIKKIK